MRFRLNFTVAVAVVAANAAVFIATSLSNFDRDFYNLFTKDKETQHKYKFIFLPLSSVAKR